jgi:hypothetical protein
VPCIEVQLPKLGWRRASVEGLQALTPAQGDAPWQCAPAARLRCDGMRHSLFVDLAATEWRPCGGASPAACAAELLENTAANAMQPAMAKPCNVHGVAQPPSPAAPARAAASSKQVHPSAPSVTLCTCCQLEQRVRFPHLTTFCDHCARARKRIHNLLHDNGLEWDAAKVHHAIRERARGARFWEEWFQMERNSACHALLGKDCFVPGVHFQVRHKKPSNTRTSDETAKPTAAETIEQRESLRPPPASCMAELASSTPAKRMRQEVGSLLSDIEPARHLPEHTVQRKTPGREFGTFAEPRFTAEQLQLLREPAGSRKAREVPCDAPRMAAQEPGGSGRGVNAAMRGERSRVRARRVARTGNVRYTAAPADAQWQCGWCQSQNAPEYFSSSWCKACHLLMDRLYKYVRRYGLKWDLPLATEIIKQQPPSFWQTSGIYNTEVVPTEQAVPLLFGARWKVPGLVFQALEAGVKAEVCTFDDDERCKAAQPQRLASGALRVVRMHLVPPRLDNGRCARVCVCATRPATSGASGTTPVAMAHVAERQQEQQQQQQQQEIARRPAQDDEGMAGPSKAPKLELSVEVEPADEMAGAAAGAAAHAAATPSNALGRAPASCSPSTGVVHFTSPPEVPAAAAACAPVTPQCSVEQAPASATACLADADAINASDAPGAAAAGAAPCGTAHCACRLVAQPDQQQQAGPSGAAGAAQPSTSSVQVKHSNDQGAASAVNSQHQAAVGALPAGAPAEQTICISLLDDACEIVLQKKPVKVQGAGVSLVDLT